MLVHSEFINVIVFFASLEETVEVCLIEYEGLLAQT